MPITQTLLKVNFRAGRRARPEMVVLHATEGTAASVHSWFSAAVASVSAHYMVKKDGQIDQFVLEADEAWHAGRVDHPTSSLVKAKAGINPNAYSIGIEHELLGHEPLTPAQLASSISLVSDICKRYSIPVDRTHIVGHHEIYSLKTCPNAIDVDAIVRSVQVFTTVERPAAPKLFWSDFFQDWLIVTKEVSNTEWYFVNLKDIKSNVTLRPTRAQTPMSEMIIRG